MERLPWELLDKYFTKRITHSEQQILDNWIAASDEHTLLFKEIDADYKAGLPFPGDFNEDTSHSWKNLQKDYAIPRTFNMPLKKLYRLATAIMIPLLLAGGIAGFLITKSLIPAGNNGSFTTIFSPGGQKTRVTLPDNSIVWLNAKTTLRYASAFNESQRSVYLDGEAFFDVKHDSRHPFIVKTSDFNIKVYGTTFNVKAYKEEGVAEATLVKGKISIEGLYLKGQNSDEFIIHPNETFRYIKNQATFKKANEVPSVVNNKTEEQDDAPLVQIAEKVDVTPIVA
ncbi:MAG: FecR family protein [Bacteroidota bacterium]|nr:FecR family protein [Bacteroidota bacterium]MDP4291290.1 FecR family protein [Bacteroidota bacterium]